MDRRQFHLVSYLHAGYIKVVLRLKKGCTFVLLVHVSRRRATLLLVVRQLQIFAPPCDLWSNFHAVYNRGYSYQVATALRRAVNEIWRRQVYSAALSLPPPQHMQRRRSASPRRRLSQLGYWSLSWSIPHRTCLIFCAPLSQLPPLCFVSCSI